MKDGYRRFILVIITFLSAFLIVVGVRAMVGGYGLLDFLRSKKPAQDLPVTLADTPPVDPSEVPTAVKLSTDYSLISQRVFPSVVNINTAGTKRTRVVNGYGAVSTRSQDTVGQGSGVIVGKEGYIITNYHVIADKQDIFVTLYNGSSYKAKLVGYDPVIDISVLKINAAEALIPIKFGNSDKVRPGHLVLAFGNPFGIGQSVTNGTISAIKTTASDAQTGHFQTNVAINPGNSGGPLVNVIGEVIGINTSIYSSDSKNPSFQGISFAVPSNVVKKTFLDIIEHQQPMRGYLGIYAQTLVSPLLKQELGYEGKGGALVRETTANSPARKAGLKKGDIITSFNHQRITTQRQLVSLIQNADIDSKVPLRVWRDKELVELNAIIGRIDTGESYTTAQQRTIAARKAILQAIGIKVANLNPDYYDGGVEVVGMNQNSLAAKLLKKGDIIYQVNNAPVVNTTHFEALMLYTTTRGPSYLFVVRDNKRLRKPVIIPQINEQ